MPAGLNKQSKSKSLQKRKRLITFKLISFIILVCLLAGNQATGIQTSQTPLHHFNLPCTNCHLFGSNNSDTNVSVELKGDISNLCASAGCHNYDSGMTHPMGTLSSGELLTCLSCHENETMKNAPIDPDLGMERYLQTSQGTELCRSCHMKLSSAYSGNQHWQTNMKAHLTPMTPGTNRKTDTSLGLIDNESSSCLGCHDEISANIRSKYEAQKGFSRFSSLSNHPIGMDYGDVAMRKMSKYNYPLSHNEKIRLFNGKVGCGSCHSLYTNERKYLSHKNYRSALCFQCHNL